MSTALSASQFQIGKAMTASTQSRQVPSVISPAQTNRVDMVHFERTTPGFVLRPTPLTRVVIALAYASSERDVPGFAVRVNTSLCHVGVELEPTNNPARRIVSRCARLRTESPYRTRPRTQHEVDPAFNADIFDGIFTATLDRTNSTAKTGGFGSAIRDVRTPADFARTCTRSQRGGITTRKRARLATCLAESRVRGPYIESLPAFVARDIHGETLVRVCTKYSTKGRYDA
jgi:hypothetical protein